jgi:secreted trypsin-like serine protease
MHRISLLTSLVVSFSLLLACTPGEGAVPAGLSHGDAYIFYGTRDTTAAHQAVVLLYDSRAGTMCTGTLIASTWVLTAAHCVVDSSSLEVYFGNDENSFTAQRTSSQLIPHPSYVGTSQNIANDIALVRLSQAAPSNIAPIPPLPTSLAIGNSDVGNPLEFVGFGLTENGTTGVKLTVDQDLGAQCSSSSACNLAQAPYQIPGGSIAYTQSGGGPCSGDSGGPAFIVRSGAEYVAGVTSYGDQNCTQYGVSTKVDYFYNWIVGYTGGTASENCTNGVDDDGDGAVDCADTNCASAANCQTSACTSPVSLACGASLSGTTVGKATLFTTYGACTSDWTEAGGEIAYLLRPNSGQAVTVTLTMGITSTDLDIFLMKGTCGNSGCTASSVNDAGQAETVSFTADGSNYYILVDTFANAGAFTISVTCTGGTPVENCTNNLDDDADGRIDCADTDCASAANCQSTSENCTNNLDDDADGLVDCDDADCRFVTACAAAEEICGNGIDDDADTFVDCDDADCNGHEFCSGSSLELCANGLDDDNDGFVDCYDSDCSTASACPIPVEQCTNGSDDDGDGFVDCEDADCRTHSACDTEGFEVCNNGIDDNSDGKVDCADSSCVSFYLCSLINTQPADDGCSCTVGRHNGRSTSGSGLFFLLLGALGLALRRRI